MKIFYGLPVNACSQCECHVLKYNDIVVIFV